MIGPKYLELNLFEKLQLQVGGYCQLAIKVTPTKVNEFIHEISKKAIGCRMYYDGYKFRYTPCKTPIFRIPDNFPTLNEAIIYSSDNFIVPLTERLASICYNNDTVVLNSSHSASDGSYLKNLLLYLEGKNPFNSPDPFVYESVYDTFYEMTKNIEGHSPRSSTKIFSKNIDLCNFTSVAHYISFEIPIEKMVNFSKGKIHGTTDLLWSSLILASSAFNRKFTDCKMLTAFDLRNIMKNVGWQHVNHNTNFTVEAKNITKKSKIGELKRSFRNDFVNKCKNGFILKSVKDFLNSSMEPFDYTCIQMSNIGNISSCGDIKDAYIGLSTYTLVPPPGFIALFSTCIDEKFYRGRLVSTPSVMDKKYATKFASAIKFCMTSVNDDMEIEKTVQNLTHYFQF